MKFSVISTSRVWQDICGPNLAGCLFLQIKFYWLMTMSISLGAVLDGTVDDCNRAHMAHSLEHSLPYPLQRKHATPWGV